LALTHFQALSNSPSVMVHSSTRAWKWFGITTHAANQWRTPSKR
jgi:hypothetical protein